MAKREKRKSAVQSLDRALDIIEALGSSRRGGQTIAGVRSLTGLHKSTVHRLLATLKDRGYVMQNEDGAYRLTFRICHLSRQVIDGVDLVGVARPHLKKLCDSSQETVHLVMREGDYTVYLHRVECFNSPIRIISNVGLYRALHTTAVGKSILSSMGDGEIAEYWERADKTKASPNTIEDLDVLLRDAAATRERGYAVDNEENTPGVRCLAVALSDYAGRRNAAISISGYKDRMSDERMEELKPALLSARDTIAAKMGYAREPSRIPGSFLGDMARESG